MANNLPIIEVDYFNCIINKRILTPQAQEQTSNVVVPGSTGSSPENVWPINNVYAPPLTFADTDFPPLPFAQAAGLSNSVVKENFYIEEMMIRGGFNNPYMSYGVRAYLDEDEPLQQHRFNALIYSGIFNSRTGINRTNEFPTGTNITRGANPNNGSIQKIYAEENNLIVLQENKCSRALIDKDAIYNAEGGGSITTSNQVIGEVVPYSGEYGISQNPESFAIYSFRKYFTDRNRNAVLRLSHDGLTEISEYGMRDYFRDNLAPLNDNYTNTVEIITTPAKSSTPVGNQSCIAYTLNALENLKQGLVAIGGRVFVQYDGTTVWVDLGVTVTGYRKNSTNNFLQLSESLPKEATEDVVKIKVETYYRSRCYGGYDAYNKQYVLSIQENPKATIINSSGSGLPKIPNPKFSTIGFDEQVKGWPSFYTYMPLAIGSLKNVFYSVNTQPYSNPSQSVSITPGLYSHYSPASPHSQFYGVNNNSSVKIVANSQPSVQKNFLTIDYEGMSGWKATILSSDVTGSSTNRSTGGAWSGSWQTNRDVAAVIRSYVEGAYDSLGNEGAAANPANYPLLRAGFDRKNNKYMANLVNASTAAPGEISFGNQISGIKGYYLDVEFTTDTTTDPGQMKELYAISLNYNTVSM